MLDKIRYSRSYRIRGSSSRI